MGQLEDMSAFVRVVEAGGISRAAAQIGIAKSAMSRRLVQLEARLGVQLIQRTTRQSSLTVEGRSYYQRALQILADVDELNSAASNTKAHLEGELSIAVPVTFGLNHLTSAINAFVDAHPKIVVHLDFSDRQVNLIEEGFDVAVRIAELQDSTLVARRLAPIRIILCASPSYLESHGTPASPKDLKDHQTLHYALMSGSSWKFLSPNAKPSSAALRVGMSANNGEFLREAALRGQGVARLPTFIVWRELESGALVPVMTDYTIETLNAYAIYPTTRHLSTRVRALIDHLVRWFGGEPYWDRPLADILR